jgi:uncharacterized protein (TIGR00730 family)
MDYYMQAICVYCGSSDKIKPIYLKAAHDMGNAIARRGLKLIYGAGSTGAMGAVANAALQAGGEVIGVIPEYFNTSKLAHFGLTRVEVVGSIHERKARMIELADAFIALPGGFGTMEEFFEVLTWAQIGLHHKPIGLLNENGYFDHLLEFISVIHDEGFIYQEHKSLFSFSKTANALLDSLQQYQPSDKLERRLTRSDE